MSKRWILVALASSAGLATVVTLSMRDPQPRRVVTAAAQGSDLGAESLPTTTVADLPVDTNMQAKLNCARVPPEVEQIPGVMHSDYPAYSGSTSPEEILANIRTNLPDADPSFEITAANQNTARIENGQAIYLARMLDDGQWYVTESNSCWDFRG